MNISAVKRGIADAVRGIEGLDCYGYSPSSPVVPAFTVGAVVIDPHQTMGGSDVAVITCTVLTSIGDDESGQRLLDELLSRSGPKSIRAALEQARGEPGQAALGGLADDIVVDRIDAYRMVSYGTDDTTFYGADITVRVIGS